jgi:molecular chaperone HtpG
MDICEDLIPEYFNFVKVIVDSEDLLLDISCGTLQVEQDSQSHSQAHRQGLHGPTQIAEAKDNFAKVVYETFGKNPQAWYP